MFTGTIFRDTMARVTTFRAALSRDQGSYAKGHKVQKLFYSKGHNVQGYLS
jgi:hypothetical protein